MPNQIIFTKNSVNDQAIYAIVKGEVELLDSGMTSETMSQSINTDGKKKT
jgi:hypothetical protein